VAWRFTTLLVSISDRFALSRPTSPRSTGRTAAPASTSLADPPAADPERRERLTGLLRWLAPGIALVAFILALLVLRRELRTIHYHEIARILHEIPHQRVALALALTLANFLILPAYDALALRYVRHPLGAGRTIFASVIAYAFSQNLGFALLTGGAVRYRFWSAWGLSAAEIAQAVTFSALSFWLGILTVGGIALVIDPAPAGVLRELPIASLGPVGACILAVVGAYLLWNVVRRGTAVAVRDWTFTVPGPRLAATQLAVAALDWTVAASVLYALLPPAPGLDLARFAGLFLLAQLLGLASHVPGGLGVFETVMVLLLRPYLPTPTVLAALVAYRAIYYVFPLVVAAGLLAGHELAERRSHVTAAVRLAGRWVPGLVPTILSAATFLGGVILLFSGATPSVRGRLAWLLRIFPLGLIEASHVAASIVGVALVVLAWGIRRRLDAAYGLTAALLGVGIVASLLKGLDWEEALALSFILAILLPARQHFYRKAALTSEPFTPDWIVAVLLVLVATLWLGFFSFKRADLSAELLWRFAPHAEAARFLRGTTAAAGALAIFGLVRLLRHAVPEPALPTATELERARAIAAHSSVSSANLALLGDKALLFSDRGDGFVMYGVSGRSWVALGDPIGPPEVQAELAWRFRELADQHGGWTVFYEVGTDSLPLYIDLGLTLLKLGEEARVPLGELSLEGGARKGLRRAVRDVEKAGGSFEIIPPAAVPGLIPQLEEISNAWLAAKHTREKGFSLGRFDRRYLCYFPIAVVRTGERIVAFANVWMSGMQEELSVDLMRHLPDAPRGVMDYLFIELMLWGRSQGFRWFNLGMAPLSGLEQRRLAPRWARLASLLYRHGEHFYNFQGIRQYKEKFDPVWSPRYLASPGGLALPRILANVAALIGGGWKGVVTR
jgi:phosphatidylglycerol lysyltransferase